MSSSALSSLDVQITRLSLAISLVTAASLFSGCWSTEHGPQGGGSVGCAPWGATGGRQVQLYTLSNGNGLSMKVTDYGAIITELHAPDRDGVPADVVLGYDDLDSYIAESPYFGCIVGRCANRIAGGKFTLEGKSYQLALNNDPNHLHGGVKGFDKHVWNAETRLTEKGPAVRLWRVSPDGEEGYPGELEVAVTYTLTRENELLIEMEATVDATTLCNLAQHTYWNLGGHDSGSIEAHVLELRAQRYTPVDSSLIPTGALAPVAGTPFDFTSPKPIGRDLAAAGGKPVGYDHNFVVDGEPGAMRRVARVVEPGSGRTMELYADQPGVQFYSGNFLDGSNIGKGDAVYAQYQGFCLETQRFPDAIHQPGWLAPLLRPGEKYHHRMTLKFGVER